MWIATLLALPGLGIELTLQRASPGLFVRIVRAFLLSFAFWAIAIFATRIPFVSLRTFAWSGVAFGGALTASRAKSFFLELREHRDALPAAAFVLLALAHLIPASHWLVAPGADMSMHTFMTRLIVEANRLPSSYEPIYPIHDFGSYAAGLPSIAAVMTTISGAPVERTTLVVGLLAYPALIGGLALVALRFASAGPSLIAAWLVTATCEMHAYLLWGGNPTILSFALVFAAISIFILPERGDHQRFFPFFAAGAGLVHLIPLIGMAYAFPFALAMWFRKTPRTERVALFKSWLPLLALTISFLVLPYVFGARPAVSRHEILWVMHWQRDRWHAYQGNYQDFAWTIWPYFYKHFGYGVTLLAVAAYAQIFIRDRRLLAWIPFVAIVLLLVLNSRYWILPASPALYPERMLVLVLAPATAATAVMLASLSRMMSFGPLAPRAIAISLGGISLFVWSTSRAYLAVDRAGERITVTANDLAMMKWIEKNLPADAVIANNYGDAGAWIPALAFRAVTHPHTNPFYFDEIDAWRMRVPADHLFVGERRFYDIQYELDVVVRQRALYRQIHNEGDAHLFVVLHPRPASPEESWMGR